MIVSPWTDKARVLFDKLVAKNLSFSRIAGELQKRGFNITRNAAIGRAHRLGISNGRPSTQIIKKKRTKASSPRPRVMPPPPPTHRLLVFLEPIEELPPAPKHTRTGLLIDLEPDQCRWPVKEIAERVHLFCTADKQWGKSYCAQHCRAAYGGQR